MKAKIYIEGGGTTNALKTRCREGFRRLLEKSGLKKSMPKLVACGSREEAFDKFQHAHGAEGNGHFIALMVDSEEPMKDKEKPWDHLKTSDGWDRPKNANDHQVLFMTTCMETWIVCDRKALRNHFGQCLRENSLPALHNLESRSRDEVQKKLTDATRDCGNRKQYAKDKKSFEILGKLDPETLREHLPSFQRCERILKEKQ